MRAKQRIVTGISFLISKTEPSYTCLACSRHCETDFSSGALLTGHQQAREIELKTKSGTYPLFKLGGYLPVAVRLSVKNAMAEPIWGSLRARIHRPVPVSCLPSASPLKYARTAWINRISESRLIKVRLGTARRQLELTHTGRCSGSGFVPRILGVLLIAAGFSYLAQSLAPLLQPSYGNIVTRFAYIPTAIGEPAIILWLLIMGAKDQPLEAAA